MINRISLNLPFKGFNRSIPRTHQFHQQVSFANSSWKKWQAATPESSLDFETIEKSVGSGIFSKGGANEEGKNTETSFERLMGWLMGMIWILAEKESALFEWWIPSVFKTRKNAFDRIMFSPALVIFPYLESYIFPEPNRSNMVSNFLLLCLYFSLCCPSGCKKGIYVVLHCHLVFSFLVRS